MKLRCMLNSVYTKLCNMINTRVVVMRGCNTEDLNLIKKMVLTISNGSHNLKKIYIYIFFYEGITEVADEVLYKRNRLEYNGIV